MIASSSKSRMLILWFTRFSLALVFCWNILCAFEFIFRPTRFIAGYELSGVSGQIAIQGLGIAFLMWNVTYPIVIFQPLKYRIIYIIILIHTCIYRREKTSWVKSEILHIDI